jgi:hypothetical protein
MIDELKSIEKNETWKLVHLPTDKKCNDVKWIFKTKLKPDGQVANVQGQTSSKGIPTGSTVKTIIKYMHQ